MSVEIDSRPRTGSVASRVQMVRSPGGIEAWLLEDHGLPLVTVMVGFRGGAALDQDGKSGTARMMGGLLTQGAGSLNGKAFQQALAEDSVDIALSIERDRLVASVVTLADKASEAFGLLGSALREPHFAPEEIDRRRGAYCAHLLGQQNQPPHVAGMAFWKRGFRGHPYARPVGGRLGDLDAITRKDIVALHGELVTQARLRIAVVGAIDATALAALLDDTLGTLPAGTPDPIEPTALQGIGEEISFIVPNPQTEIYLGRPGIGIHDPDFPAAILVNHCLGGHPITSRLAQDLRETRGLCYVVGSILDIAEGASSLVITTQTPNAQAREVIRLVRSQMTRLAQDGLDEREIDAARSFLIGSQAMEMETSRATAAMLLSMQFNGRSLSWLDERRGRLESITPRDVARTIERIVGDSALLVSTAGGAR